MWEHSNLLNWKNEAFLWTLSDYTKLYTISRIGEGEWIVQTHYRNWVIFSSIFICPSSLCNKLGKIIKIFLKFFVTLTQVKGIP